MKKMKKLWQNSLNRFIITFVSMIVLLLTLTIKPLLITSLGTEVELVVNVFDGDYDFSGAYLELDYTFEQITYDMMDEKLVEEMTSLDENYWSFFDKNDLYIVFKEVNGEYIFDYATIDKPETNVYLTAEYVWPMYSWEYNEDENPPWEEDKEDYNTEDYIIGLNAEFDVARSYMHTDEIQQFIKNHFKEELTVTIVIYKGDARIVSINE